MDGALDALKREFGGCARAAPARAARPGEGRRLWPDTPLNQVATVGMPEARLLTVQVWDRALVNSVEKAIRDCGLGLNPQPDGQMVRVPIPMLTRSAATTWPRRPHKYAEDARIAVRGVRRDGMEQMKALQKKHDIREDDERNWSEGAETHRRLHQTAGREPGGERKGHPSGLILFDLRNSAASQVPLCRRMSPSSWMATDAGQRRAACRASPAIARVPEAVRRDDRGGVQPGCSLTIYSLLQRELAAAGGARCST